MIFVLTSKPGQTEWNWTQLPVVVPNTIARGTVFDVASRRYSHPASLLPLGQEIAFAATLADRHHTVAGILSAVRKGIDSYPRTAIHRQALSPDAPLAAAHKTQYPILQGPMNRVSDVARFCQLVADHGGLPFLALGLMKPEEVQRLLDETRQTLGDRSWGVGLLGFVPPNMRQSPWEVVRARRSPFALVAGGHPRHAVEFEAEGIMTYLHVIRIEMLRDR